LSEAFALHGAGRLGEAAAAYRRILAASPSQADALHHLGLIEATSGNLEEADRLMMLSDRIAPGNPDWRFNLGRLAALKGDPIRARDLFESVLAKSPRNADALMALGGVLLQLGQAERARERLRAAYRLDKKRPDISMTLGLAEMAEGNAAEAETLCRQAVQSAPEWADAHNNLAYVLRMQGRDEEAKSVCDRALALQPAHPEALVNLGIIAQNRREVAKARDCFERAVNARPGHADARFGLADISISECFLTEGRAILADLIRENPRNWRARWLNLVSLPLVYESAEQVAAERLRFSDTLNCVAGDMEKHLSDDLASILGAVGFVGNFYLHYTGGDVREIQEHYGRLLTRIASAAYPKYAKRQFPPRKNGKIKVGFASSFLYCHSVMKSHACWITDLPRDRFDVVIFRLGGLTDETTEEIKKDAHFVDCSRLGQAQLIERIYAARLDALIWLDIGMDAKVQIPAALRLAPVQATGFGHPVTSGLSAIDAYLTGDLMEPVGGEAHYIEKLVRLPNLSVSYQMPDVVQVEAPEEIRQLKAAGRTIYLCAQSLFKLLPAQDDLVVGIARAVPDAVFVFIAHAAAQATETFRERLSRRLLTVGISPEKRIVILPRLGEQAFQVVNRAADVVLDSIGWSGFNSTMEALAVGTPVVTMPGATMRAHHTCGILQMAGLNDLIASNVAGYVELAVRLGTDAAFRKRMSDAIIERRGRVFDDPAPVRALAEWIEISVQAVR
jgi:protein O-GlcNAc transferase